MDGNKAKEGISVKELENFARKHRFEVFFCALFVLACIFSFYSFFRPCWSIILATAGGVLSVIFPGNVEMLLRKMLKFVFGQDMTLLIVFGVVGLILAIFLPLLIFFVVGLCGGRALYQMAMDSSQMKT
jgi:hypothetical protein